ncbi:MAG: sulfite exporter TauE/SafE family protein [Alphaproteobacteria bacterium]
MLFSYLLLVPIAFAAGIISSIAGGGAFLTFPALMFMGLDPRAANITSTIAMYPMQVSTGFTGRKTATGTAHLSFNALLIISLVGGIIGALMLIMTSPRSFAQLVPWLLLFATGLFAWGSLRKKPSLVETHIPKPDRLGRAGAAITQFVISVYGGYFGGGIGLLMLAALTYAGMNIRQAATTKNILAAVMNTSAVGVFLLTADIHWLKAAIVAVSSTAGGLVGVQMIHKVNERYLCWAVVAIGTIMSAFLFLRAPH